MVDSQSHPGGEELEIGRLISSWALWGLGREIGDPALNDDGTGEGMFDIKFDDATPPIALEVTTITDGTFVATASEAQRVATTLNEIAAHAGHGRWDIYLTSGTRVRSMLEPLSAIIKGGQVPHPASLPPGVDRMTLVSDDEPRAVIWTTSGGAAPLRGFSADLAQAIRDNAAKLAAAVGCERHLAVDRRMMLASDPSRTPPPPLPPEIDYLWVVRRSVSATGVIDPSRGPLTTAVRSTPIIWLATNADGWRFNIDPLE